MKPYQKILGISVIILMACLIVLVTLAYESDQIIYIAVSIFLLTLAGSLTLVLMLSYKNRLLRRIFLFGMPLCLLVYFLGDYLRIPELYVPTFGFMIYFVGVNLVVNFLRFDLNLIIVTFLVILGLMFKRFHFMGGGAILTFAALLIAVFSVINAIRAFRTKDNRYLSIVVSACCFILALTSFSFLWKVQHMPKAGMFMMVCIPLFIIVTLIILLTLPGSNFIEWTRKQKQILLRGVLIPWLFYMYIIAVGAFSPGQEIQIFFFLKAPQDQASFYMEDYDVENRNGLE